MKKLLLLPFLALFSSFIFAQDTPDDFANRVRYIFQHVDASQASTGILMDCGVEFVHMDNYTGYNSLNDSNYVNLNTWRGVYASLYSAKFNSNINFTDFPTINSSISAATADTLPNPLLLLNYNYQVLRADAISANLMYASNDQLYDIANRTQSPYTLKTAFAIAPAEDYLKAINGYSSFIFKSSLMFGNTGKTISTLKIDLGDGQGLRTVQADVVINTQYSSGGFKIFNYEVTYTDNSVYTGHSRIYVDYQQEIYSPGGGENRIYRDSGLDTVIAVSTSTGIKHATLQVRLSEQHMTNAIEKPLIIVEGIDFWRITTPNDLTQNTDITDFLDGTINRFLFPNNVLLRDSLDLLSYDIIYIDFEDGADYLENNSALTQAAIQWINNHKTTNTQNVVMGLSMGAVIARHALRTMELNSVAHDTRLYVSMDGPHQGANFPLSLQALIQHLNKAEFSLFWGLAPVFQFKDAFAGLDVGKAVLDAPASKQLLTYRIGTASNLAVDNSAHDNFYSNYHSMGFPTQCRNIAISNGSECASDQGFAPLTTIFDKSSSSTGGGWVQFFDIVTSGFQLIGGVFTNKPLISLYAPLALLSTKTSFEIEFNAKALPDHGTDRIYKGRAGISRKVLGFINVNTNITNRSAYAQSYMLPLDSAPGGRASFSNASSLGIPTDFATLVQVGGFGYIPTVSALDIGSGNTTIGTPQLYAAYSINNPPASPYNTSFSSFVTAVGNTNSGGNNNEDHVTFTPRNGGFLLKELQGNTNTPSNCAIFCDPSNLIQGPSQICSDPETYTIPNLPAGATVAWSVSPSYLVSYSSTTANSITLTKLYNGTLELSATVNSACGNINLTPKKITVGTSVLGMISFSNSDNENQYWCSNNIGNYFTIDSDDGNTTYEARILSYPSLNVFATNANTHPGVDVFGYVPAGYYVFQLRTTNSCGTSDWAETEVEALDCSVNNHASSKINTYPNPANTELNLELKNNKSKNTLVVKLLNSKGDVLIRDSIKNGLVNKTLETKDIPNGIYYLHIIDGKETIKKQIIIAH